VQAADVAPRPWRNGGGTTRELLAWPAADSWQLRISVAEIRSDGPFSAYPGVERWFAVIDGAGVWLRLGEQNARVVPGDPPLCFDGALSPDCRPIDGATHDLNLMLRGGRGAMHLVEPGVEWRPGSSRCGLFSRVAGTLHVGGHEAIAVVPLTLLWFDEAPSSPWAFHPAESHEAPLAWWLSFTPSQAHA
jgi:environmental stress-induced protein Ves